MSRADRSFIKDREEWLQRNCGECFRNAGQGRALLWVHLLSMNSKHPWEIVSQQGNGSLPWHPAWNRWFYIYHIRSAFCVWTIHCLLGRVRSLASVWSLFGGQLDDGWQSSDIRALLDDWLLVDKSGSELSWSAYRPPFSLGGFLKVLRNSSQTKFLRPILCHINEIYNKISTC